MDVVTSLLPIDALGNCICDPIKNVYSLMKSYKGNLHLLKNNLENLRAIKDDIARKVEHGESKLEEVTNEATLWLQSVGALLEDEHVKDLLNEDLRRDKDQCCFRLIPCNFYQRYKMSQVAKSKADEMQQKLTHLPQDSVTLPKRAMDLDPIPSQHCKGLNSRAVLEQRILELLKDDRVDAVGLYGMGGVGKTTLAENIKNKGAIDTFDAILMVEISQVVNIERIQDHIAAYIGLSLDGKESLKQRATKLYNALKQVKPKRNDQLAKILIIMDNIWEDLKLDVVGIPHERTSRFCCKILFTSRERSVCKSVGVLDENIVDVNMLEEHESRSLFWENIRNVNPAQVDKPLVDRLLRSCGGLPLAIVTLAKSLSVRKVSTWPDFADELEKPISCRSDDVQHDGTCKIIEASYKFIGSNEKKMFLLLACLYPFGLSIPIEDLMRYGIGLNLFSRANSLIDIIKQANRWTDDLISSSLLLDDYGTYGMRKVKIHDVVRSYTILCAEKLDGHKLMVEAIPQWQLEGSWEKYTAISLTNDSDTSHLRGMQFNMLETLLLKPYRGVILDDDIFQGMVKLKILVLPQFRSCLPKSIQLLTHLRTLHLEDCDLRYEDLELICELVGLVVLSLRRSKFEMLPHGLKKLSNLRLLDLHDCMYLATIPANVLGSLTQLEGLYMLNSYGSNWEGNDNEIEQGAMASIAELRLLFRLKVLEIEVTSIQQITSDMMEFITNKDKLIFHANKDRSTCNKSTIKFHSVNFDVEIGYFLEWFRRYQCLKRLLPKSNHISVSNMSYDEGLMNLVPDLDSGGFQMLEKLSLHQLEGIKRICDGQVPPQMFYNLRKLELWDLNNVESYVLPIDVAPNLTTLHVSRCSKLKYIWMENVAPFTQKQIYQLHSLKVLQLDALRNLSHALGNEDEESVEYSKSEALFNTNKIRFPSLEELEISRVSECEKLWEWEISKWKQERGVRASPQFCPFPNLRKLLIGNSRTIKTGIGSPSVAATLLHLETLQIIDCENMREVISEEKEDETHISPNILTFPKLLRLELEDNNLMTRFVGGSYKVCFPTLKEMKLYHNNLMTRFVGLTNNAEILPEKVEFPSLETLRITSTPIPTPRINWYSLFQNLRVLNLDRLEWKHAFCKDMVVTIGLTLLTFLEVLNISRCEKMEEVVEEIDDGAILTPSSSSSSFNLVFPRLSSINLAYSENMRWFLSARHAHIVLHFPSLQQVIIELCNNMELFSNVAINAPKLANVRVRRSYGYQWTMDSGDDINNFISGIYKSQTCQGAGSASTSSATLQEGIDNDRPVFP